MGEGPEPAGKPRRRTASRYVVILSIFRENVNVCFSRAGDLPGFFSLDRRDKPERPITGLQWQAKICPVSAFAREHRRCTAGKRPCNRRSAPAFCLPPRPCSPAARLPALRMSLRATFLQPRTLTRLQHVIASHVLATANTSFLLHVIANQCAHWCGNPFSPQGNLATWQYFGRIRTHAPRLSLRTSAHTGAAIRVPAGKLYKLAILRANSYALSRIRPRHCSLLCPAAGTRIATSLRSSQ